MEQVVKKFQIKLSKTGKYCLNDMVEKIICSKNIKKYIENVKDKTKIGTNYYVDEDVAKSLIYKGKSDKCKSAYKLLATKNGKDVNVDEKSTEIDIIHNKLIYNGTHIRLISDGENWFRSKDIALILGYENTKQSIADHVDDDDKKSYKLLHSDVPSNWAEKETNAQGTEHPSTIYINESGIYSLIMGSKKPEAKQFKRWVTKEVLPSIRKTGQYSVKGVINALPQLIHDINKSIYTSWVYIIRLSDDEYKFGITIDIKKRLQTHDREKHPVEVVKLFPLPNYNVCMNVENKIKFLTRRIGINLINEESPEHFRTTEIYTRENIMNMIEQIVAEEMSDYNDNQAAIKQSNPTEYSDSHVDDIELKKLDKQIELQRLIMLNKFSPMEKSAEMTEVLKQIVKDNEELNSKIEMKPTKITHAKSPSDKNTKKSEYLRNKKYCADCGELAWEKAAHCQSCANKHKILNSIKNGRPTYKQLKEELKTTSCTKVAKKYNVSDNCINKWLRIYEKYGLTD